MYGIYENGVVIARFVTPLTVKNNTPVSISDALSLGRNVTRRVAQRWEIETKLEPLYAEANELFSNLVLNGHHTPVTVIMPQNIGVIVNQTSNVNPGAVGLKGASLVTISSNTGLIPKGTFIKFSNHSKVYMTTTSLEGNGNLGIYPELRTAVSGASVTHRDDVIMTCYYDTDTVSGMTFDDGLLMDVGTVKLIEKVN
jgi:hypothetical protein